MAHYVSRYVRQRFQLQLQRSDRPLDLYYLAFPNECPRVKVLTGSVFLMESAQTFIVTNDYFNTYAKGFTDIAWLNRAQNEWVAVPVLTSLSKCELSV